MQPPSTLPDRVWLPTWAQRALIALSTTAILLPAVDMAWGIDPTPPPAENRNLAEWPPLTLGIAALQRWPGLFEGWQRDHFGLRSTLIHWHSVLMLDVLGVSPRADVVLGKAGWLFLGTNKALDAYRCIFPFTPAALASEVAGARTRDSYLKTLGIRHMDVWAPLKHNVYPEFLPAWIQKSGGPCRFDQLREAFAKAHLPFTDLRPAMAAAKRQGLAYHRTDTHWNARGAFFGYSAIARELSRSFKDFVPLPPERVRFVEVQRPGGDLARQLDLVQRYAGPEVVAQILAPACRRVQPSATRPKGVKLEAFDCDNGGPRVLMFADSYGNALIPFLAESAGHLLAVEFGGFDKELIALEKPDVVIDVRVERQMQPDR